MEKLSAAVDQAKVAFGRLSQREQFAVVGMVAFACLVVLLAVGAQVASGIEREERRVHTKSDQLLQVLALEGDYRARQREHAERLRTLGRANVRLVSLVEDSARAAGVDIGQLRPEDAEAGADGIVESRVDLRASGLSADRLQDFLGRLEAAGGLVVVRRLKVERPYRRDTADLDMTVSSFRLKGA